MNAIFTHLGAIFLLATIVVMLSLYKWVFRLFGIVIVPDDSLGTVTKKFVLFGPNHELPPGKIVALLGEAGLQADTLAPGLAELLDQAKQQTDLAAAQEMQQAKSNLFASFTKPKQRA